MTLQCAILAGGLATRLGSLAADCPKSLVDVAGRPFLHHQLDLLRSWGVERVVLCVGHLGEQIQESVGDGTRWGCEVSYSFDAGAPAGTGGALIHARRLLDERFFVMYGDTYLDFDYPDAEGAFHASGLAGYMTVYRNSGRLAASNVQLRAGRVGAYDKDSPSALMKHIDYGLTFLSKPSLDGLGDARPLDLAACFRRLAAAGMLGAYAVRKRFYEIGSPSGLEATRAYLRARAV